MLGVTKVQEKSFHKSHIYLRSLDRFLFSGVPGVLEEEKKYISQPLYLFKCVYGLLLSTKWSI